VFEDAGGVLGVSPREEVRSARKLDASGRLARRRRRHLHTEMDKAERYE